MPTRSYYFPTEFSHIENILRSEQNAQHEDSFNKFRALGIAPLFSGMDLAIVLGIGPGLLRSILINPNRHYNKFPLIKSDGSRRCISSPRTYLKVIQWWLLDNILIHLPVSSHAFGFRRGVGITHNAAHHLGSRHFLNVDIKSFFDSVQQDQVLSIFELYGYNHSTSQILSELCCLNGCLPQGAPTSPAIGNQVLRNLDNSLSDLCGPRSIKYSRYADDLTFSSRVMIDADFLREVSERVSHSGFELKAEKTRWAGPGGRTEVTGLIVREFVQPPLGWRKKQRAALHNLKKKGALSREDIRFLEGIKGYSRQFPDAIQIKKLADTAHLLIGLSARLAD